MTTVPLASTRHDDEVKLGQELAPSRKVVRRRIEVSTEKGLNSAQPSRGSAETVIAASANAAPLEAFGR